MKFLFFCHVVSLVVSGTGNVTPRSELYEDFTLVNLSSTRFVDAVGPALGVDAPPPPSGADAVWHKAYCRGAALARAMTLGEEESMAMLQWPYIQSPWDGDMKPELRKWGYLDDDNVHANHDGSCDFGKTHIMQRAFDALGVDSRSAGNGGPNHCFRLQHSHGPTVMLDEKGKMPSLSRQRYTADGKTYKVTGASSTTGINRNDGIVYFLNRRSPEQAAADLWNLRPDQVDKADLPKLRSSSDLAWALWNRVPGEPKIKIIMSVQIANTETANIIIPKALRTVGETTVQRWPGTDISVGSNNDAEAEAALALIGSPNGLGAGYFLLQHKKQLGGANFIYKIKIFKNDADGFDDIEDDEPSMILYVDKHTPPMPDSEDTPGVPDVLGGEADAMIGDGKEVRRSRNGNDLVREHVLWAKL